MAFLQTLKLHNFRCYDAQTIEGLSKGLIVLHGANGAGKTNVLEAISLLSPGRGLRTAKMGEIQKQDGAAPWAVFSDIESQGVEAQIGTGADKESGKRMVRINGATARGQSALAEYLACVWLTPQMDRLFLDSSSHRRRFLDRLVFAFDPGHSGRVTRYENAMRQRSRLLQEGKNDPAWLTGLESQMAETGVAIAAARREFIERLQRACDKSEHEFFPRAELSPRGALEELLASVPALEVEEMFTYQLAQSRGIDMRTGGAASGPHKSDLHVKYAAKNMAADQCSTGEQKALLIGIILAHSRLIAAEKGAPPILLLDEVAAHLDEQRRAALYELLMDLGGQVWLTGTDKNLFDAVKNTAQFFEVSDASVNPMVQNATAA
jgi:DNA replication and repair protein RecF